jgi:hypothetical protein
VARSFQNPQYRVREQLFFLSTVGNDFPLKRDLRNPPNAGRCGHTLLCFHFADEGCAIQISHARDRCDAELTGYAEQSGRITYVFAIEAADTWASSRCDCSQLPNFAERYNRRSRPSTGISGVELEWMPTDLDCFPQDRRRFLQATLRHEAPWTNQIRSHVDDQAVRELRNSVCMILNHV